MLENLRGDFFLTHCISCVPLSTGNAEAHIRRGGNLNRRLMARCVRNIRTKNYKNLINILQVTINNVGNPFLGHGV